MEKIRREAEPRNYTVYSGDLIELKGERSVGTITQLSSFPSPSHLRQDLSAHLEPGIHLFSPSGAGITYPRQCQRFQPRGLCSLELSSYLAQG